MGLRPAEFLDFIQRLVNEEKRLTPFKDGRPSYEWYRSFMARNNHIIQTRHETPLESCRAKLTRDTVDAWYTKYRDFVINLGLTDKPSHIFNADESGFSLGSKAGKIIGPPKKNTPQVPHVTGGQSKQRLTVMFCGSASGYMLPLYLVYPAPCPRGYNPLTGGIENSDIAYTPKGWMDSDTFQKFLEHFNKHCGKERPVILLIDSVSSHIYMSAFEYAKSQGIELYRLIPNATHIMQPMDKGVFGPLKRRWLEVVRRFTRENPGCMIGKENFAQLLKEAFLLFYRPLTVINSFKSSGIYPVDSTVISATLLKPGLTFCEETDTCQNSETPSEEKGNKSNLRDSLGALTALESALDTPVRQKYKQRIEEGYDIEHLSPCFQVYKRLHIQTHGKGKPMLTATVTSAEVEDSASPVIQTEPAQSTDPP